MNSSSERLECPIVITVEVTGDRYPPGQEVSGAASAAVDIMQGGWHKHVEGVDGMEGDSDGWGRAASAYRLQEWLERPALRTAIGLAGDLSGLRVLDAAAGTGLLAELLRSAAARPSSITMVDRSPLMLARAAHRAGRTDQLLEADLTRLPLPDASFDVVFANYVLHVIEPASLSVAVAELHRVLRPGGVLVSVTPWSRGTPGRVAGFVSRVVSGTWAWHLWGLRPLDPGPAFEAAGFEVTTMQQATRGYPSRCIRAIRPR